MGFGTILAGATFFLVLFRTDPASAGALGFTLFYAGLGLTLCGAVSIIGFLLRVILHRDEMLSRLVGLSFRQAVLLSALAVGALVLRSRDLLSWWNCLLLIIVATVVEFIFISLERKPKSAEPQ
jgi:Ca2+/Na+ antiporter